jgi:FAD-dependent sensor of blue light
MIYYLVYLSAASHLYSDTEMLQVLSASRKKNLENDITGILLYHEGSILQVLEGEKETVTQLYERIKQDERHGNIITLTEGPINERSFAEWSMGFKMVNTTDWNEYAGYFRLQDSSLLSIIKRKNLRIDATLKSFVKTNLS